jgi:hypothetical protein
MWLIDQRVVLYDIDYNSVWTKILYVDYFSVRFLVLTAASIMNFRPDDGGNKNLNFYHAALCSIQNTLAMTTSDL